MKPYFSVLIPSYNRPKYLNKCIKSILYNNFKDYEIIISDDDSPEINEIERITQPYLKHKNITFIKQSKNIGMANNWNFLVSSSKGKYLIILGNDDKLLTNTLSRLKYYIEINPDYDLYGFGYNVIDQNGRFCYSRQSINAFRIGVEYPESVRSLFVSGIIPFWIFHPFTICYRKDVSASIMYDSRAANGSDLLFLYDCINSNKRIFVIPEVLFCWRKNQGENKNGYQNLSNVRCSNIVARYNIIKLLEEQRNIQYSIEKIVSTYYFRKHFFYDSILIENSICKLDIEGLNLTERCRKELTELQNSGSYCYHRIRVKMYQIYEYIKLFGFKGVMRIIVYGYDEMKFKLRMCYKTIR